MDKQDLCFAPPDHKYIQCDARGCGKSSPQMRCSSCRLVYYCSKECQKQDWREHKIQCRDVHKMKQDMQNSPSMVDPNPIDHGIPVDHDGACGICLEEPIRNPYTFKTCRHAFCYPCVQSYQIACKKMIQDLRCPLCRAQTEDVQDGHLDQAYFHVCRAQKQPESSQGYAASLQLALDELQLISKEDKFVYVPALLTKVTVMDMLGKYESAIQVIDEIVEIDKVGRESSRKILKTMDPTATDHDNLEDILTRVHVPPEKATELGLHQKLTKKHYVDLYIVKACIYERMENWEEAYKCFNFAFSQFTPIEALESPEQHLVILSALSRCLYHRGKFDHAIQVGKGAILFNRHHQEVHKYVALSYKAKGELEKAKKYMTLAVLYETPWDEEHVQKAKLLLHELLEYERSMESSKK